MRTNTTDALIAGFAGAAALTAVHQGLKYAVEEAPRLDRLAEQAIRKGLEAAGAPLPDPDQLHWGALAGDLAANTAYFSIAGAAGPGHALLSGTLLGMVAGFASIFLPGPMGLDTAPVERSRETKLLTLGLYTLGGMIAGAAFTALTDSE